MRALAKGHAGVLLVIDEAQGIADRIPSCAWPGARDTLDAIHNGAFDFPVMVLAGGLGHSEEVLRSLGVSRLQRKGGLIALGPLSAEAERRILRDWLVKTGGAVDASESILQHWITALAAAADRWPQQILCFASGAAEWLTKHQGVMPADVPESVMAAGLQAKQEYNERRANAIDYEYRVALARVVGERHAGEALRRSDIVRGLMQVDMPDLIGKDMRAQAAAQVFRMTVEKGVLTADRGRYYVPVPSVRRWLVETYGS